MIFADSNSFFKVWEIEKKDNYNVLKLGTSRKDKRADKWLNSNWPFVRFVGEAKKMSDTLEAGDRITGVKMGISWEPYEKNGQKMYSKSPRITVFEFSVASKSNGGSATFEPSGEPDDGDLPF